MQLDSDDLAALAAIHKEKGITRFVYRKCRPSPCHILVLKDTNIVPAAFGVNMGFPDKQ